MIHTAHRAVARLPCRDLLKFTSSIMDKIRPAGYSHGHIPRRTARTVAPIAGMRIALRPQKSDVFHRKLIKYPNWGRFVAEHSQFLPIF